MVTITATGVTATLDETAGLQNATATPSPAGDANDNDISASSLPSAFSTRLTALGAGTPTIGAALSGYTGAVGNTGSNIVSITPDPGATISGLSLSGAGGASLNGVDSGLDTITGTNILLYSDTNDNIVLGRAGGDTGPVVFALYLEEVGSPPTAAKIWSVQYAPLTNPVATNPDDPIDLTNQVFVAANQNLEFSLANAPSGQNLFLMFTVGNPTTIDDGGVIRVTSPTIIATGKDPANQSTGVNITTGDTINTSQAGGPTTFGTNSQMITEQEGVRFSFVTGARQNVTIPNLDQNEADVEANIDFTNVFNAKGATFDVVQLQSGKSAVVKISAFSTAAEPGTNFIDGYGNDTKIDVTSVKVTTSTGGTPSGVTVTITNGIATISGVQAGYHIEYTATADHNRVLIENGAALNATGNTHADFDIGGFKLLQVSTATAEVGSKVTFEDDGPSISTTGTEATLTVDETILATNATASFAANFTSAFGADAAGTLTFALGVSTSGANSGLVDTATGNSVFLFVESGQVVGREGTGATDAATGAIVFTASVVASGVNAGDVTLDQQRAVVHPDATNPDDSKTLSADNLVALTGTITDRDGDSAQATLGIGQNLVFKDDGPTLNFGNLVGTGTIAPQYGEWIRFVGADQPGDLDISLNQFQLVRPDGTIVNGSSFTFNELAGSPNASGDFLFQGALTANFDNNAGTPDTTVDFTLTALNDGRYVFDLEQGFGSTVTLSSANGSLDAGGPDSVRTLTIPPDEQVVFFGVQPTTSEANIISAIGLGEPDLTEAQIEGGGFSFLGTANMNVSTAGIGIGNNNLDGNTTAGINAGDESFVVNPETLLTGMKVFIDNSVGGYDPSTEELYYKIFYENGTTSGNIKVGSTDQAAGGQRSFMIDAQGSQLIDSVQLTMGKGTVKIPVIEFIKSTENLASDVKLDFTTSLADKDGDTAASNFSVDLFANDLSGPTDFTLVGASSDLDGFNVALAASEDSYRVEGFDTPTDTLFLLGDAGAGVSIDNTGADSIVSVTETGGQATTITVVGVDLVQTNIVLV